MLFSYGLCLLLSVAPPRLSDGEFPQAVTFSDTLEQLSLDNGYRLVRIRNSNAHQLRLVRHQQLIHTINFPNQAERAGFSVNWVRKTPTGFTLSIEYGTRIWVDRSFFFTYCKNHFYLAQIRTMRLDKARPENLTDTNTLLRPNIMLTRFTLTDYIPL